MCRRMNSFNKLTRFTSVNKGIKRKEFSIMCVAYATSFLKKPNLRQNLRVKRQHVLLKSPFHFKTPKHHLYYSFYVISLSFCIKTPMLHKIKEFFAYGMVLLKPTKLAVRTKKTLALKNLVLFC